MFEKFMDRFNKKDAPKEEKIEFKPYEEVEKKEVPFVIPSAPVDTMPSFSSAEEHSGSVELKVIRPEAYDEVSTVADNLLAGCTVVLNMEVLDRPTMMRMLDFLNGVTYCTDGEIKKVAPSTFIITPHSDIDISDM